MKKEIRIDELRALMLDALTLRGIGSEDAAFIVDDFLDAELEGHKTHGVSKFLTIDIGLSGREGSIEIVSRIGGHAKIDGHRELGHIAARQAAALSVELAKEQGVGLVALTNVSRYARLVPYSRLIAERGCIGIVTNNGGPAHVVPFGGSMPVFGTNPLSFGFPQGEKPPLIFDFATAQGVWGELRQAIVVEGRYDKNALCQLVDAPVIETHGFGVMKDKRLLGFLRQVAAARGLIILTDSDGAGFVIRNFLKGALPPEQVLHAYIPDVPGKERRKRAPGKEGKLGVEGMPPEVLLEALRRAGAQAEDSPEPPDPITKTDLYLAGLSGGADSAARRRALQQELGLPEHLGSAGLLQALNLLMTREEFQHRYGELR